MKNTSVGHNFPAGTVDSNEAWLEIMVSDANNYTFFSSGQLDANNEISKDSITFGATLVDRHGNETDRRNSTTDAVAIQWQRIIKSGSSQQVYYSFHIPETPILPIHIHVKLNWHKYSPKFAQWVLKGAGFLNFPLP